MGVLSKVGERVVRCSLLAAGRSEVGGVEVVIHGVASVLVVCLPGPGLRESV